MTEKITVKAWKQKPLPTENSCAEHQTRVVQMFHSMLHAAVILLANIDKSKGSSGTAHSLDGLLGNITTVSWIIRRDHLQDLCLPPLHLIWKALVQNTEGDR